MKKKLIALSLGFTFLIAGFGVSYDFDFGTFEVNSNEVKAVHDFKDLPQGEIGCIVDEKPGKKCINNNGTCPNDEEGCVSVI